MGVFLAQTRLPQHHSGNELFENHPEDDASDRPLQLQMSVHAVSHGVTGRRKNGRACALGRVAAFLSGMSLYGGG
ncbi:hypothetical protein [Desulfovibrio sp. SGI.169]|uniref:hypothetical protein n=1 Tax=Desulfovibrio sp. SGI.169 TaxID=3420561 RepID=UPI003D082949